MGEWFIPPPILPKLRHKLKVKQKRFQHLPWLAAGCWIALLYGSIPLARIVQQWVQRLGGPSLFLWMSFAVLVLTGIWLMLAGRHGSHTFSRFGTCVLLLVAVTFAWLCWRMRGNPEETFHFIQYGVLSWLLFRAFSQGIRGPSVFFAASMAGICVGIVDELIQWIMPTRTFDFRDIGFNALAVLLVQLAIGANEVNVLRSPVDANGRDGSGLRIGWWMASLNALLLLFCVSNTADCLSRYQRHLLFLAAIDEVTAEYGFTHQDPAFGTFFSRLDRVELARQDRQRSMTVAACIDQFRTDQQYSQFLQRFPAYQDPILTEVRIHLFRRDRYALMAAQIRNDPPLKSSYAHIAVGENQILEVCFPHILAQSSYHWPPLIKAKLLALSDTRLPYHSPVSSSLITRVSKRTLQIICVLIMLTAAGLRLPAPSQKKISLSHWPCSQRAGFNWSFYRCWARVRLMPERFQSSPTCC